MSDWTAETAEWYAERYGEYPTNRLTVERLELAPNSTILDIGCGTAAALRHAAVKVPAGTLIGVDPVPRMVEIAKAKLAEHPAFAQIQVSVAPAHALPVDDASVDVVLALDSYDHWAPHQREGLAEVRRVLAPGGRLVIVKDASVSYAATAKQELLAELALAGFEVVEEHETAETDLSFTTWSCVVKDPSM